MYSPKLILGSILSLIPLGGGIPLLLNSINSSNKLNEKAPHWNKLIEVKFYGKDNTEKSIKVWIQNLTDISKAEYLEGTDNWKPIGENKKYVYLANLAKEYLLTQHRINVASSFSWLGKDEKEVKDLNCAKCKAKDCGADSELSCFFKCCKDEEPCTNETIKKNQKDFAVYLTNIYSNWNDAYLQPLQAHIHLGEEVDLKGNENEEPKEKPKKMVGTVIYGFTDYQYKSKAQIDNKDYRELLKNGEQTINNKYFINHPQIFNLEENDNNNNLKKLYEDSEKNINLEKSIEQQAEGEGECNTLQCLISKNYIKSFEKLEQPFKDILNCLKSHH